MESVLDDVRPDTRTLWLQRGAIAIAVVLGVGGLTWFARSFFSAAGGPARQVARIAILPDTPPPPPPEERKPEPPKEEPKPVPMDQPKPVEAPTPPQESLKMEGPAGDGPSAFEAGTVRNDYTGGEPGPRLEDSRPKFAAFANDFAQQVREILLGRRLGAASVRVFVWLDPDGAVLRYETAGGELDREARRELDAALADLRRARSAPPAGMPMPVGLQITLR